MKSNVSATTLPQRPRGFSAARFQNSIPLVRQLEALQQIGQEDRSLWLALSEAERSARQAEAAARRQAALLQGAQDDMGRLRSSNGQPLVSAPDAWSFQRRLLEEQARQGEAEAALQAELRRVQNLRQRLPEQSSVKGLLPALLELQERRLHLLRVQRRQAAELQDLLTLRARQDGTVEVAVAPGAVVTNGTAVARVVPAQATEVTAYLPADASASSLLSLRPHQVRVATSQGTCEGTFPLRLSGQVTALPEQLGSQLWGQPRFGLPVHIELPDHCRITVGQVVRVFLSLGSAS